MKITMTKIRKQFYEVSFEIMQLEKEIPEKLEEVKKMRERLKVLKKKELAMRRE